MVSETGLAVIIGVAVGLGCTLIVSLCVLCILMFNRKAKERAKSTPGSSRFSRKSSIITVSEWDGSTKDSHKIYRSRQKKRSGDTDDISVISSKSLPLRSNSLSRDKTSSLRLDMNNSTGSLGRPNSGGYAPNNSARRSSLKNIWNCDNNRDSAAKRTVQSSSVYVTGNDVTFAPLKGHDLPPSGVSFTNDGRLLVGGMPGLQGRGSLKLQQQHSFYK